MVEGRPVRFSAWVALVTAAGLAVRVGYVLQRWDRIPIGGDSFTYSEGAELLVAGYGFIEPLILEAGGGAEQAATHPPLYLLWLAVASLVDPGPTSHLVHMLWSCVLGAATVVLCGLVGRQVAGPRCGLIAAVLAAFYPHLWQYDGMLLSETMSQFTVALVLLTAYRFWKAPGGRRAAELGLSCGLATLSRPELLLTLVLVVAPLVLLARSTTRRTRLRWLAAAGAPAVVLVGAWVVFNLSRFEEPVYLTHGYGFQLIAANCDDTYYGDRIGFWDAECAEEVANAALRPGMDASERELAVREEALEYMSANRERLPVVVAARWGRITGLYRPRQQVAFDRFFYGRERWVAEAGFVSYYLLAALAVAGAVALRRRRVPVFPLAAFPVIALVAVALVYAETRYRSSAEAALVVLAAAAVDAGLVRLQRRRPPEAQPVRARVGGGSPADGTGPVVGGAARMPPQDIDHFGMRAHDVGASTGRRLMGRTRHQNRAITTTDGCSTSAAYQRGS